MRTLARLIIIRWLLRIFSIRVVYSPLKSEPTFENAACHHCPRLPKAWPLAQLVIRNIRKGHLYSFVLYSQCRSEPTFQNVENIYSRFFFFEKYVYSFSMINVGVTLSTQHTFLFFKISFFLVEIIGGGLHLTAHAWGSKNEPAVPRFIKRTCSTKFAEKKIIEWFLLTTWEENSLFFSANRARPGLPRKRKIRNFLLKLSAEIILLSFSRQPYFSRQTGPSPEKQGIFLSTSSNKDIPYQ